MTSYKKYVKINYNKKQGSDIMKKLLTIGALLLGISTLGLGQEVTGQTTFSKSENSHLH